MRLLTRGVIALVGMAMLGLPATTAVAAGTSGTAGTQAPASVNACDQATAAGVAHCLAKRRTDSAVQPHVVANATPSGYGPASLRAAYNLTAATGGTGQTVAIVDAYDDPNAESDLGTYRAQYGLTACTTANGCFKKVNENGQPSPLPSGNTGWAGEISLDIDMVSAICANCHILLVEATSASYTDLGTAVNTAVASGAKYVSNSYGGSESSGESSLDTSYYHHPGVAITASTGDSGYGISYPASSPYVTAVGGTTLSPASNARGWTETAWSGAGSGCSGYEAKPSFQGNVTTGCANRADADVSAVADPNTGVAVYQTYGASGWAIYGGTSVASPIIASVYALAGTPGSTDTPAAYPYAHPGSLFDVTGGSNGNCTTTVLCTAGTGWDGPTGLGTPNGTAAFVPGGSTTSPVQVANPGSQSGKVGTAVSLQLSASGGTSPYTWTATGLPAGLSINASTGLISGTPSTAASYSVTATAKDSTGVTGSASFNWTVAANTSTGCTGQKLGNPGFESGGASWSATSGVIGVWSRYGEPPHSGSWNAWLDGYGRTHTDTLAQSVAIPAGCHATLSFWLHTDSQDTGTVAHDTLTVKLGTTTVAGFSNLNRANGYTQHSYDVSAQAGKTVTLVFTGTEDNSLATSFVVDDTAITLS